MLCRCLWKSTCQDSIKYLYKQGKQNFLTLELCNKKVKFFWSAIELTYKSWLSFKDNFSTVRMHFLVQIPSESMLYINHANVLKPKALHTIAIFANSSNIMHFKFVIYSAPNFSVALCVNFSNLFWGTQIELLPDTYSRVRYAIINAIYTFSSKEIFEEPATLIYLRKRMNIFAGGLWNALLLCTTTPPQRKKPRKNTCFGENTHRRRGFCALEKNERLFTTYKMQ